MQAEIVMQHSHGSTPVKILNYMREAHPDIQLTNKDISNITAKVKRGKLNGLTPVEFLINTLKAKGFYYVKDLDPQTGEILNLFYIHQDCIELFKQNPDIILLDSTYKTNRYKMAMLNIGAVGSDNKNISVGVCFMRNENYESHQWTLQQLRKMINEHSIELPLTIITDRELALMNPLQQVFPESRHLLCAWHVNQNVRYKTKGFFPKATKEMIDGHPLHNEFCNAWNFLLQSPSNDDYNIRFHAFTKGGFPTNAVEYCTGTWLVWKEKLVQAWVDDIPHFRNTNSSILEGMHRVLKDYIDTPNGDLLTVFEALQKFWSSMLINLQQSKADKQRSRKQVADHTEFTKIRNKVFDNCLEHLWGQIRILPVNGDRPPKPCTGNFKKSMGLPCLHDIWRMKHEGKIYIQMRMIHPHWHIIRPSTDTIFEDEEEVEAQMLAMRNNKTDQRRQLKKATATSNKRERGADRILSTFEREVNDYKSAPTYANQQVAGAAAQDQLNGLSISEIEQIHKRRRLEHIVQDGVTATAAIAAGAPSALRQRGCLKKSKAPAKAFTPQSQYTQSQMLPPPPLQFTTNTSYSSVQPYLQPVGYRQLHQPSREDLTPIIPIYNHQQTTNVGLQRIEENGTDPYQAGTRPSRAYELGAWRERNEGIDEGIRVEQQQEWPSTQDDIDHGFGGLENWQ